jgi:hypothetical protein
VRQSRFFFAWVLLGAICSVVDGEDFAQPPESFGDVQDVFYDDAFQALSGDPPDQAKELAAIQQDLIQQGTDVNDMFDWQTLIEAETLKTEIKRIANNLTSLTASPAKFEAAKLKDCPRELATLATLFRVIDEYPGDIPWQKSAAAMERRCLQTAEACEVGSDDSLAMVKETCLLLDDLLRGQAVEASEAKTGFPQFAPLMQRMEITVQEKLPSLLAKPRDFRKQAMQVVHEAELLAMLSQVIRGEDYGYGDDKTYQDHADALRDAANQLKQAAKSEDFSKAVEAESAVKESCAACHADFRG